LIAYDESTGFAMDVERASQKRPLFPPSQAQHFRTLDLVHCDLNELTQTSIDGYKYTATFLDDATSFGYVALIKKKTRSNSKCSKHLRMS